MAIGGVNVGQTSERADGRHDPLDRLAIADAQWALDKSKHGGCRADERTAALARPRFGRAAGREGAAHGHADDRGFASCSAHAPGQRAGEGQHDGVGFRLPSINLSTPSSKSRSDHDQATTSATSSSEQAVGDENRAAFTYQYGGNWWSGGNFSTGVATGTRCWRPRRSTPPMPIATATASKRRACCARSWCRCRHRRFWRIASGS